VRRRLLLTRSLGAAICASFAAFALWRWRTPRPFLHYDVKPLAQSGPMNCWAATYAMLVSWKNRRPTTERKAVEPLGDPWLTYLDAGMGLPGGQELLFVDAAGLAAEPPASYPLDAFLDLLRTAGPLWIITGDGISAHARLAAPSGPHNPLVVGSSPTRPTIHAVSLRAIAPRVREVVSVRRFHLENRRPAADDGVHQEPKWTPWKTLSALRADTTTTI
jgi:hypothetical protein